MFDTPSGHEAREGEREVGNERDRHGHENHDGDVAQGVLGDVHHLFSRDRGHHVEIEPDGRRQDAHGERDAHDDPELHDVEAEALHEGHEDRHRDEEDRRPFEEAPHDDEDRDDEHENGQRRREGGRHEGDRLLRNARVEEHVLEEPGRGDDEHHLGGLLDRVPEDLGKILEGEGLEDEEPEDRHVERRDRGRFRRGEETREHAADHDHRGEKREEGLAEGVPAFAPARAGRHGVAAAVRNVGGPEHEEDPEENARNRARRKEGVHARLREARVENERDARRNDRTEGAARGDRRAAERPLVAGLRHFGDGDHADAGRASSGRA